MKYNLLNVTQLYKRWHKVDLVKQKYSIIHKKPRVEALSGVKKRSLFVANLDSTKKDKIYYF